MQPVPIAREVGMANTNLNASNQTILVGIRSYHWSQASAIPWLVLVLNNHHVANLKVAAGEKSTWIFLGGFVRTPFSDCPRTGTRGAGLVSIVSSNTDLLFERRQVVVKPALFSWLKCDSASMELVSLGR